MKRILYISLGLVIILLCSCRDLESPYVGYVKVERVVLEPAAGSKTVSADTDLSDPIIVAIEKDASEWCQVSVNGKDITVKVAENVTDEQRFATVSLRSGYRVSSFQVIQKKQGLNYLEYLPIGWKATCSSVQTNDGGGIDMIFNSDRTKFWHSSYNPSPVPPPHWLLVDLKKDYKIDAIRLGWRLYGKNNYATVKVVEVFVGTDEKNLTSIGEITKAASNGISSPDYPAYDEWKLNTPVTAKYIRVLIKETNTANGTCQVAYVKAFEILQ